MRKYAPLVFLCACLLNAQAQDTLTNDTIVKLAQAGVSSETIIKTIAAAGKVNFHFLPYDLQMFEYAKVSDDVVKAMAAKSAAKLTPAPAAQVRATQTPSVANSTAVASAAPASGGAARHAQLSTAPGYDTPPSCT